MSFEDLLIEWSDAQVQFKRTWGSLFLIIPWGVHQATDDMETLYVGFWLF